MPNRKVAVSTMAGFRLPNSVNYQLYPTPRTVLIISLASHFSAQSPDMVVYGSGFNVRIVVPHASKFSRLCTRPTRSIIKCSNRNFGMREIYELVFDENLVGFGIKNNAICGQFSC